MRLCIVPEYPLNLMTGGLQIQAVETCKAMDKLRADVDCQLFSWSDQRSPADLYHFIGFPDYLSRLAELVRQAKKPYVVTLLFGSENRARLWAAAARNAVKSRIVRTPNVRKALAEAAAVIAITESDAEAAQSVYGVSREKIHIVPNGVSDFFFNASPTLWHNRFGSHPFVLCVGAIQARKNQYVLLQACNELSIPVTLLGPILPGESDYAQKVASIMKLNEQFGGHWLTDLTNDDPLLHSAFAACKMFALLSKAETQPLSIMQAMAAKKPVILLDVPYASQKLFQDLPRAKSLQLPLVRASLHDVWLNGKATFLPQTYTWKGAAEQLVKIYADVLTRA